MTGAILGPFSTTWVTRAFSIPSAIPSCRRIGSAISGATEWAADSYSDYLTGAAIPLAAPSGKRMYDAATDPAGPIEIDANLYGFGLV